jgi:hypothetical protein
MKNNIIDFAFSVVAGVIAALFGYQYSVVSAIAVPIDLPRYGFPVACVFLMNNALWELIIPVTLLLLGILFALRRNDVGLRIIIGIGWCAALAWLCLVLVVWPLASVPIQTGMKTHY